MHGRSLALALLVAAMPLASAAYADGSSLEADAPVLVEGRADSLLPNGIASFVSSSASTPILVHLTAEHAGVILRTYVPPCTSSGVPIPSSPPCTPTGSTQDETVALTDAIITVTRATSAYQFVATTDRSYGDTASYGSGGTLVVTTGGTTSLTTNDAPTQLSGSRAGWAAEDQPVSYPPVYHAETGSAQFGAAGAVVAATGAFEAFLQGVEVSVRGVTEAGRPYEERFDTRIPSNAGEASKVLLVETTGGTLRSSSAAPFTGFAPADQRPITDVHSRANFEDADGEVRYAGNVRGPQEHAGASVSLTGPLSLQLTAVSPGRLTYAISDGLRLASIATDPNDEPLPPAALAAAGAAGASLAGLVVALGYFWPRLKFAATLLFLPMYTRIGRDAVLQHEKRDELYELIRLTPGIHAHEIGEKAKIGWGTTVYHLKLLENHGLVVSKKTGRYKRFFVNTGEYTKKKDIYGALRNETAKAVADYIVAHPGTSQKEMCAALSIQPSLASWHVEKLEAVELVKRVKDGRMVRYFAGPAWTDLNATPAPTGPQATDAPAET